MVDVTGESLDSVPLLEVVDLSWNAGLGGDSLHSLTSKFHSGCQIRELHLVDCQLTDVDMKTLGEDENITVTKCLHLKTLTPIYTVVYADGAKESKCWSNEAFVLQSFISN